MKNLKYDYSELEEFLEKEYPEKESLADHFMDFCSAYMKMSTYFASMASGGIPVHPPSLKDGHEADWAESFMDIFNILGRLPEVQEGGAS